MRTRIFTVICLSLLITAMNIALAQAQNVQEIDYDNPRLPYCNNDKMYHTSINLSKLKWVYEDSKFSIRLPFRVDRAAPAGELFWLLISIPKGNNSFAAWGLFTADDDYICKKSNIYTDKEIEWMYIVQDQNDLTRQIIPGDYTLMLILNKQPSAEDLLYLMVGRSSIEQLNNFKGNLVNLNAATTSDGSDDYAEGKKYYDKKEYVSAMERFRKAAEKGHADAMNQIGWIYENGYGVTKNHSESVRWYQKAAEAGSAEGMIRLGYAYEQGKVVSQSYTEAVKWYRKAAENGDATGMIYLGYAYMYGEGVSQNYTEAVKWFRKAAESGKTAGMINLGHAYEHGKGVSQNNTEAVKWYRKAAEGGNAIGMINLGHAYVSGESVSQNLTEAVKWYRKAAEQGLAEAQYIMGYLYFHGEGMIQDYNEAKKWLRKAAEQGHAEAQYLFGYMYFHAKGVTKDDNEALKWFRKAAEQGHADSQKYLNVLLE